MKKTKLSRGFAFLLSVMMLFSQMNFPVLAATGEEPVYQAGSLCEHHAKHNDECGHAKDAPCAHEHTEDCDRTETVCVAAVSEQADASEEEVTSLKTKHECTVGSGCLTKELDCKHQHDDACGFAEPSSCTYQCEICGATSGEQDEASEPIEQAPKEEPKTEASTADKSDNTITAFDKLETAVQQQTVPVGTELEGLELPNTLKATVDAQSVIIEKVTWELDPANESNNGLDTYDPKQGAYCFTPVLPNDYKLAEGVSLPEIWVMVNAANAMLLAGETGDLSVTGGTLNTDYSYADNILTIKAATPLTISGTTTADQIVVQSGITANITLNGVNIDLDAKTKITFNFSNSTLNLTLAAGSETILKGGEQWFGALHGEDGTLVIDGEGSLTTEGSSSQDSSPGISAQNITINRGTVSAQGSPRISYGMSASGTIKINGGTVTARNGSVYNNDQTAAIQGNEVIISGGMVHAMTAGHGYGIKGSFTTTDSGNALIVAKSILDQSNKAIWRGVIFEDNQGKVYGNHITLQTDADTAGKTLTIEDGKTLTVGSGMTLTNSGELFVSENGSFINTGTVNNQDAVNVLGSFSNTGTWINESSGMVYECLQDNLNGKGLQADQYVSFANSGICGDLTISGGIRTIDFTYKDNTLTIQTGQAMEITGTTEKDKIVVADGITANLTLNNVSIKLSQDGGTPFLAKGSATVNLTLKESSDNRFSTEQKDNSGFSGSEATITIDGKGSLDMNGSNYAYGIHGKDITIKSGGVSAYGGWDQSYGIFATGTLTITGGTVSAGNGSSGSNSRTASIQGENVIISGGTVYTSGSYGEGISGLFTTTDTGNALIVTTSIADRQNQAQWHGVFFERNGGKVYGDHVILQTDANTRGKTLIVEDGKTLTIDTGVELISDGVIQVEAGGTVENKGVLTSDGFIYSQLGGTLENSGALTSSGELFVEEGGRFTSTGTVNNQGEINVFGTFSNTGTWENQSSGVVYECLLDVLNDKGLRTDQYVSFANSGICGDLTISGGIRTRDFTYKNNILTVQTNKNCTISGTTDKDKVVVADGQIANLTLNGLHISLSSTGGTPFAMQGKEVVNLTLAEGSENSLVARQNDHSGLSGNETDLTINGKGRLKTTGAGYADGINCKNVTIKDGIISAHGGWNVSYGIFATETIEIKGGVVTVENGNEDTNKHTAAMQGNNVVISGGTVYAIAGYEGDGIKGAFTTTDTGNAFIVAKSIADQTGKTAWHGVIFEGNDGKLYGDSVTLQTEADTRGKTLTIEEGKTLTLAAGMRLVNSGTMLNRETINIEPGGRLTNNSTAKNYGVINNKGTIDGTKPIIERSETTVSFTKQDGSPLSTANSAAYGDTVQITATAQKKTSSTTRSASVGTVDFWLGAIDTGTKLGSSDISVTADTYTATTTLALPLTGTSWVPSTYVIYADFGGYGNSSLMESVGSASLTVTKGTQPTDKVAVDSTNVTYGGTAPIITEVSTEENATVTYSVVADKNGATTDVASINGTTLTIENAGDFYVKAVIAETNNYTEETIYSDKITVSKKALAADMIGNITPQTYTGQEIKPALTVTDGSPSIIAEDDYTVGYEGNINAGTATATITAKSDGNYSGSAGKTFTINKAELTKPTVDAAKTYTYNGTEQTLVLTGFVDATMNVSGNQGTAAKSYTATVSLEDPANYAWVGVTGTDVSLSWEIEPKALTAIMISDIDSESYTGSQLKPVPTVMNGQTALSVSIDYTVRYGTNVSAGTNAGIVTVTGIGNYTGSADKAFTIVKAPRTITVNGSADSPIQITLEEAVISDGKEDGTVTYAKNSENTVPEDGWQSETVFTKLLADTDYYFFARISEGSNYEGVTSTGILIHTPAKEVFDVLITTQPNKLSYQSGEKLDLTGLVAKISYNDNTSEVLEWTDGKLSATPANDTLLTLTEHHNKTVSILYGGQSDDTTALTVTQGTQEAFAITQLPEIIHSGDTFTLATSGGSGTGSVTWTVTDGEATVDADGTVTVSGAGDITIQAVKESDADYLEASAEVMFTAVKVDHTPIDPPNPEIAIDTSKDAVIAFNGDYADLAFVKLNGHALTITPDNDAEAKLSDYPGYTGTVGKVESGSVIVTLYKEFLQTLSSGKYTLEVGFNDGVVEGSGNVVLKIEQKTESEPTSKPESSSKPAQTPDTGDSSNLIVWVVLILTAGSALSVLLWRKKKEQTHSK